MGRPKKEFIAQEQPESKETTEKKNKLLDRALQVYSLTRDLLVKDDNGKEVVKIYEDGINEYGSPILRIRDLAAEALNQDKRKQFIYKAIKKAVIRFITVGGKLISYYEDMEKDVNIDSLSECEKDGIVRKIGKRY